MNSLVVLVAAMASLVHAAPSYYPAAAPTPVWHGPLATPVVLPSGYLADTPEVAALKAAQGAALASAPGGYAPTLGYVPAPAAAPGPQPKWHGPLANPVVLPSGYLADTPEVAALKAAQGAALASAPGGYAPALGYVPAPAAAPGPQPKWHGPLAAPVVLPSGYLADTPEVVALRAAHAAARGHGYYH